MPDGFGPSAVAIGKFDGVHAGHRAVIRRLKEIAARVGVSRMTVNGQAVTIVPPRFAPGATVDAVLREAVDRSPELDAPASHSRRYEPPIGPATRRVSFRTRALERKHTLRRS